DVMSVLAPEAAAPRLLLAPLTVEAPVPPSVTEMGPGVPFGGDWVGLTKAWTGWAEIISQADNMKRTVGKKTGKNLTLSSEFLFIYVLIIAIYGQPQ
ncbi:MAG: hypothetical protein M1153_02745, partial [Patescibacteria group bacterium]|nr:hypothetical protein [Patescibacteria group bacterium]